MNEEHDQDLHEEWFHVRVFVGTDCEIGALNAVMEVIAGDELKQVYIKCSNGQEFIEEIIQSAGKMGPDIAETGDLYDITGKMNWDKSIQDSQEFTIDTFEVVDI